MSAIGGSIGGGAAEQPGWVDRLLDKPGMLFAAAAVLIPSLPGLIASIFVCPNRIVAIAFYMFVAAMSRKVPSWLTVVLLVAAVFVDVLLVVSGVFKLEPSLAFESIKYAIALDPFASVVYLVGFALIVLNTIVTAFLLIRYRTIMQSASMVPALLAFFAMIAIDVSANSLPEYKYSSFFGNVVPFESAIQLSGLSDKVTAPGYNRKLLIVMVEGMGAFTDPAHRKILSKVLSDNQLGQRYEFSEGMTSYVGHTTGAESREFCGSWGDFRDYMDKSSYDCLPAALTKKGYKTAAFHAFSSDFFSRGDWFPRIGFQDLNFLEHMTANRDSEKIRYCGLTWRGLCDVEVGDKVEAYLTKPGDDPRFAYWLTLNSHMPINPEDVTPHLACEDGGPFDDKTICNMTELWIDVFDRVKKLALNPDLSQTDILIVGDHHPPVWTRSGRAKFLPGKVVWYRLSAKQHKTASN